MDPIKEAFGKIKQDIHNLQNELTMLRKELQNFKQQTNPTHQQITPLQTTRQTDKQTEQKTQQIHNLPLEPLKTLNKELSIGNQGVPTHKQTNRQTPQQTHNTPLLGQKTPNPYNSNSTTFDDAENAINSLNLLKGEIKRKFKALTPNEMLVFSTIYLFQEQHKEITYKAIAAHLNLSESSIRDYVIRLIRKEVPIIKKKINNKLILLSIASNLCKNLSLSSIMALRQV